mmetsp:Transcript_79715/g.141123  ORF Transcript_79715/g.141123 Transcript_79715/m.141123 type:complete len:487 (+) Transcript_79715:62-1522(+)
MARLTSVWCTLWAFFLVQRGDSEAVPLSVTPQSCKFAVVGGGWAGIYAAWRVVVDEKIYNGSDVCLFEASGRFGGRTYTVFADEFPQLEGLNLDIGAYRFAFQQHLPADLLRGPLNMSTGCYIPSCKPDPLDDNLVLHRLVDPTSRVSIGYGSALGVMMQQLSTRGVHMLLHHKLDAIYALGEHDVKLLWNEGSAIPEKVTRADVVFLNLPRHGLNNLAPDSVVFKESPALTQELFTCTAENYGNESKEAAVKVYLIYEDAWWLTILGLKEGEVHSLSTDPPVYIRYHDGPTHCQGGRCRGALLVQYAHTLKEGSGWYMKFQPDVTEPKGLFTEGPLLTQIHQKLLQMHAAMLRSKGVDPNQLAGPVAALVGFWPHSKKVVLAPSPDPLSFSTHNLPPCVNGMSSAKYWKQIRKPVASRQIFLANNDWWLEQSGIDLMPPYWAEVSLRTAERVLHDHMGLSPPRWLNSTYFHRSVLGQHWTEEVLV